ncbi:MAG: HNH endonuclease [Saprospiraceae bacterium]|nr:HNH endonuclease [Saprospiraceae bacterium]
MSRRKIPDDIKAQLAVLSNHRCEYCLSPEAFSTQAFEIDHILAMSLGGDTVLQNLAYCCRGCNSHKFNKFKALDELTGMVVPIFNPREQTWKEHFAWDADPLYVIGLTPCGRATIDALKLNRPKLIELRELLLDIHRHPPEL